LREQLDDCPQDLSNLVQHLTARIAGEDTQEIAANIERWIVKQLGPHYPWPGNVRELEQCVRNYLIRRHYQPRPPTGLANCDTRSQLSAEFLAGSLTGDQLLSRYCTFVYAEAGTYEQTAQRVGLDRRTVKSKIDLELLARLKPTLVSGE
jgi:DNA-binding NtrC family response regulator